MLFRSPWLNAAAFVGMALLAFRGTGRALKLGLLTLLLSCALGGGVLLLGQCCGTLERVARGVIFAQLPWGVLLGAAIAQALGDKKGIRRVGSCFMPMDESLSFCALDISGRPYLEYEAELPAPMCGDYASELCEEFFRAVAVAAGLTLHLKTTGRNTHHMIEAMYKAFARALRDAAAIDPRVKGVPSTKGVL